MAEMAKCTLRCAICHRVRTHQERHWLPSKGGDATTEEDNVQLGLFDEIA